MWFPENREQYRFPVRKPWQWKPTLWAYVDGEHAKDAALAFRLAIQAEGLKKYEVFVISAKDIGSEFDKELIKKYYPDKVLFTKEVREGQSLYDWSKAKAFLGYQPRYTWRDIIK